MPSNNQITQIYIDRIFSGKLSESNNDGSYSNDASVTANNIRKWYWPSISQVLRRSGSVENKSNKITWNTFGSTLVASTSEISPNSQKLSTSLVFRPRLYAMSIYRHTNPCYSKVMEEYIHNVKDLVECGRCHFCR